jgi:chitin synthase
MSSTNPYGQNLSSPPAVDGNYYSRPTAPPSPDGRPAPPSRLNISIPDNDVPRPHGRPSIPNKNSSYKSTGGLSKAGGGGGGHVGFEGGPDASVEQLPYGFAETTQAGGSGADVRRKKSLVRPERERHNPNDRLAHYRQHAANMESNGSVKRSLSLLA